MPEKFFGGPSWAIHSTRLPLLVTCKAMPSPTPPNPPRVLWSISFMFFESVSDILFIPHIKFC